MICLVKFYFFHIIWNIVECRSFSLLTSKMWFLFSFLYLSADNMAQRSPPPLQLQDSVFHTGWLSSVFVPCVFDHEWRQGETRGAWHAPWQTPVYYLLNGDSFTFVLCEPSLPALRVYRYTHTHTHTHTYTHLGFRCHELTYTQARSTRVQSS